MRKRLRVVVLVAAMAVAMALAVPSANAAIAVPVGFCTFTGVIGPSGATAVLVGEATAPGAVAATNISCRLVQNGVTVLSSSTTLPGMASATARTGTIPLRDTAVCARATSFNIDGTTTATAERCIGGVSAIIGASVSTGIST